MTTLIRGGTVYDGSGSAPRAADILIQGTSIARIAPRVLSKADEVIEANGALVAPGFIDITSYADHYGTLFSDPAGTESLIRGITTLVVGNGGASLAPRTAHSLAPEAWWGSAALHGTHTTTVRELLAVLKEKIGVNVATLAGYATIREGITLGTPRDLTDREFSLIEHYLRAALSEGAFGISVNLEHVATAGVPRHELTAAARIAREAGALFALRLRDREEAARDAFAEALAISEATKVNILITDLEPSSHAAEVSRALAALVTRASAEHHLHFTTSGLGLAAFPLPLLLPPAYRSADWSVMRAALEDLSAREAIRAHLARFRETEFSIAAVADPSLKLFEGTRFTRWSLHEHLPFEDALLRLMKVTGLRAVLVGRVGDSELAQAFVDHNRALIASGEAAAPALELSPHLTLLMPYPKAPTLESRIAKMTSLPAKKLGLTKRGLLREGFRADLIVIEKQRVREAFVNGVRAIQSGAPTGRRGGEPLAHTVKL